MVDFNRVPRLSRKSQLGLGAAVLLALGAAGGAGAVAATRPGVEMAPRVAVPIASLARRDGVVTVKGRVTEVFGDKFVIADGSGKAMVSAGRDGQGAVSVGQPVLVQGRYDEGQLRASFLVDGKGRVEAVGPGGRPPHGPGEGPRDGRGPGRDGPPPPPTGGPGAPPPPPPGGPGFGGPGAPPPPPGTGCPPAPPQGADAPPPPPVVGQIPAPVPPR